MTTRTAGHAMLAVMTAIKVSGLAKRFGRVRAVDALVTMRRNA